MEIKSMRERIQAVPSRHNRNIISFCTVRNRDWNFDPMIEKLDTFAHHTLVALSSETKIASKEPDPGSVIPVFVRRAILCAPDFERGSEDEDTWADNLVQTMRTAVGVRIHDPQLTFIKGFEKAHINLVMALLEEFDVDHESRYDLFQSVQSGENGYSNRRLSEDILTPLSKHPDQWEMILTLVAKGIVTSAAIEAVLTGEVVSSLAVGAL